MTILMHATRSIESVRPLRNAERVARFRSLTQPRTDHERMERDAQIAAGIRWLEELRTRPIPRRRALVPLN
jgi:hypothetical protein